MAEEAREEGTVAAQYMYGVARAFPVKKSISRSRCSSGTQSSHTHSKLARAA